MITPLIKPETDAQRNVLKACAEAFGYTIELDWSWHPQDLENLAFVSTLRGRADLGQQVRSAFNLN